MTIGSLVWVYTITIPIGLKDQTLDDHESWMNTETDVSFIREICNKHKYAPWPKCGFCWGWSCFVIILFTGDKTGRKSILKSLAGWLSCISGESCGWLWRDSPLKKIKLATQCQKSTMIGDGLYHDAGDVGIVLHVYEIVTTLWRMMKTELT